VAHKKRKLVIEMSVWDSEQKQWSDWSVPEPDHSSANNRKTSSHSDKHQHQTKLNCTTS